MKKFKDIGRSGYTPDKIKEIINNVSEFSLKDKQELNQAYYKYKTKESAINQLINILNNKSVASLKSLSSKPEKTTSKSTNPVKSVKPILKSTQPLLNPKTKPTVGKGLSKGKIKFVNTKAIFGRGISPTSKENLDNITLDTNKNIYIELSKLKNNNILSIKYKSNHNNHPKFTQQRISQNLSDIIQDIINKKLDDRLLKTLNSDEKIILDHFLRIFKIKDIVVDKKELENFNNQFDVLMGEISSGNNNPEVKQQLKQFVYRAVKLGRIKKSEGIELLLQI